MFFSQDWRERIKTENPDAGFGEVGKLLGAKWKEMDDEEKKVRFCPFFILFIYLPSYFSPTSSRPGRTRPEPRKKRPLTTYVSRHS